MSKLHNIDRRTILKAYKSILEIELDFKLIYSV